MSAGRLYTAENAGVAKSRRRMESHGSGRFAKAVFTVLATLATALYHCGAIADLAAEPNALQSFATHLSFNGYKCSTKGAVLKATHLSKPAFTLSACSSGVILKAWFQKKDASIEVRAKLVAIANVMNDKATVARFFVDGDGDLIMEAWYPLPYTKENFSSFLGAWETDFVLILREHYAQLAEYIN